MKDREVSGANSDGDFNKLFSPEDVVEDEQAVGSIQERQQVSMSLTRPESSLTCYKWLTVGLAVLAAVLLAVDIGLGVYYNRLSGGQKAVMDINAEVNKLEAAYKAAARRKDEAKKELAKVIREQQLIKWELEHQKRSNNDYGKKLDTLLIYIAGLRSHIPLIEDGCRHCLPGWTYMHSMCYYFTFSEAIPQRPWQEARQFCLKQGGDLAKIDTREKQLAITKLINNYPNPSKPPRLSGFWIGLRDVDEEGMWKWTDKTRLTESYWIDGEPNNIGNEDCAAIYPRINPFKTWNDVGCQFELMWICQMLPRVSMPTWFHGTK